ncbi:hypothetical protein [Acinetobacter pittii]|uniref:hypothetical protein n=1 Tax=Acinetobacter pittii TaxID=48296 RepID=UPI000D3D9115|nr:hypothetical protein [Acinetobacter pittii]PTV48890.1 hypothetical protein DBL01_08760 [Acinetobacter pittii]
MKRIYIWLIFTVLIGLLPVIARITTVNIFLLQDVIAISSVDIIVFGIVLHVSILNELNNLQKDSEWRSVAVGTSTLFIIGYALLLSAAICSESKKLLINVDLLLNSALILALISFIQCFIILYHYRKIEMEY